MVPSEWDILMTHWAWRFTDAHVFIAFIYSRLVH